MEFHQALYETLRQGNRGLAAPMPPLEELARVLLSCRRVLILTGFPVDCGGYIVGETDGPCGAAEIAGALTALGCRVTVATDEPSYPLVKAAVALAAPGAETALIPLFGTAEYARMLMDALRPDLVLTIERPGKATDGHFHNMRGHVIDYMTADTDCILSLAAERRCVTVAVGDGGNELGMGALLPQIVAGVPHGAEIAAVQEAQYTLVAGVSNWWGPGLSALLSHASGRPLMLSSLEEAALLRTVSAAGGVDGCTGEHGLSVDGLPLEFHLTIRPRPAPRKPFTTGRRCGKRYCPWAC